MAFRPTRLAAAGRSSLTSRAAPADITARFPAVFRFIEHGLNHPEVTPALIKEQLRLIPRDNRTEALFRAAQIIMTKVNAENVRQATVILQCFADKGADFLQLLGFPIREHMDTILSRSAGTEAQREFISAFQIIKNAQLARIHRLIAEDAAASSGRIPSAARGGTGGVVATPFRDITAATHNDNSPPAPPGMKKKFAVVINPDESKALGISYVAISTTPTPGHL